MPRHFSKEEREQIRERLIEAGLEMFEKFGPDKTNIEDITAMAGIVKGSFYKFFNSKGDLFMEIYSTERQKAQKMAEETFAGSKEDIDVLLKQYMHFLYEMRKNRPILDIAYEADAVRLINDKTVRDRLLSYNREINRQMTEMIRGWFDQRGQFDLDARLAVSMIWSVDYLQFYRQTIGPDIYEQTVEKLTDAITQYVKNSKITQ